MATINVECPLCRLTKVIKYGRNAQQKQRYQCCNLDCPKKVFILDYKNKAWLSDVKDQIIDMTLSGSGIRDIARVLGVSIRTVISVLKKKKVASSRLIRGG